MPNGVFIDPSEYRRYNLNFHGKILAALVEAAIADRIKLLQTNVSVSETKRLIQEHVTKACNQFKKPDFSVLKPIDDDRLEFIRNPPNTEDLAAGVVANFEQHLADANCEVLSVSDVDPAVIFDAYFNKQPPFDDTKKKEEFPDAFTLQRLVMWADENDEVVYVVSSDDDVKRVCDARDQLRHFEKIEGVTNHINQAEDLVQRLNEKPQSLIDQLERYVLYNFSDRWFVPLYNDHGDVQNVEVANVEIGEIYAIDIADGQVESEAEANVAFSADVSYEDLDTGYYDKEVGEYFGRKHVNVEREDESTVTVLFNFSLDEGDNPVASDITIAEESISVEEEDRGDYGMYK